ncbi:4Fe-4S binding protein [bacterium]|nr:4Fe-4S binding protein [bacterium]
MCQFCHQHGDGKKWYLNAKNYSDDLLSDARRRQFSKAFAIPESGMRDPVVGLEKLARAPAIVQNMLKPRIVGRSKRVHFGQVLPLEDVAQVFAFLGSIVRVPCICRTVTVGREVGYCYGVALSPGGGIFKLLEGLDSSYMGGPDTSQFDHLTAEEAVAAFREHEQEGLCHTVWTFITPLIGGVCNCDRRDCLAMKSTIGYGLKMMFRGEYVANVDPDLCVGCRACMRACQFGALGFGPADKKAFVEPRACYGCGICRSACSKNAIALTPRAEVPAAANLW